MIHSLRIAEAVQRSRWKKSTLRLIQISCQAKKRGWDSGNVLLFQYHNSLLKSRLERRKASNGFPNWAKKMVEKKMPRRKRSRIAQGVFKRVAARAQPTRMPRLNTSPQGTLSIPDMIFDKPKYALERATIKNRSKSQMR
jgi:hypothetical protein